MRRPPRQHLILTLCIAAVGIFLAIWGCPYLRLFGHEKLCIALFVLLALIFIYGRSDARDRSGARTH